MILTLALQKRRWINYDSDAEELERMIVTIEGSNPEEGDGVEKEAPPSVMGAVGVP